MKITCLRGSLDRGHTRTFMRSGGMGLTLGENGSRARAPSSLLPAGVVE